MDQRGSNKVFSHKLCHECAGNDNNWFGLQPIWTLGIHNAIKIILELHWWSWQVHHMASTIHCIWNWREEGTVEGNQACPYENHSRILTEFGCVIVQKNFVQILYDYLYQNHLNWYENFLNNQICTKITRVRMIFVRIYSVTRASIKLNEVWCKTNCLFNSLQSFYTRVLQNMMS